MKLIDGQLYGYSYELNNTAEADLTTCYAVDTGTMFVAFGGVWYEQSTLWSQIAHGGESGGGSTLGPLVVDMTMSLDMPAIDNAVIYESDMKMGDVAEAWNSGREVYFVFSNATRTYRVSLGSVSEVSDRVSLTSASFRVSITGKGLCPALLWTDDLVKDAAIYMYLQWDPGN